MLDTVQVDRKCQSIKRKSILSDRCKNYSDSTMVSICRSMQIMKNESFENWEEQTLSPRWGMDEGIPSEYPRLAVQNKPCRVVDVAYLGHKDGNPESLPCMLIDYFSPI